MESTLLEETESMEANREKLAEDLRLLIRDAEALLKSGMEDAGDKVEGFKSRLQSSAGHLKEQYFRAQDKVVDGAKATDKVIRGHPYESIGVAFGVGLLIGVLVTRK